MPESKKRLLLIGSTQKDVHLRNYFSLIEGYFDEILLVSGKEVDFCKTMVLDFGLKNPFAVKTTIRQLRKIMIDFQPSIVHVHQANSFGYITSKANKGRFPQVLTIWGSDVLLLPQKSAFHRYIVKTALKNSDRITADASFIESKVNALIGSSNFTTANFGIDLPNLDSSEQNKQNVIYSNRLHDDLYNIDQIIKGFAVFAQNRHDWKLVIAGKGGKTEELKQLAGSLLNQEQYEFIGFVDYETNIRQYLKARIYASIPSSDGTSVSLLEAMACGAIPVLSDLPANHEWIETGKNGVIVESEVALAMEQASLLDSKTAAELNKAIIEQKATKKANREIFIQIYESLIS